jgi:hypothetical protein
MFLHSPVLFLASTCARARPVVTGATTEPSATGEDRSSSTRPGCTRRPERREEEEEEQKDGHFMFDDKIAQD